MFGADDDDDVDDETGGHTRYPVMPSLVAMQQMKNRLHLAYLGKKLMKWTAMATGKELRRLAFEMNTHYDDYGNLVSQAFLLLARARYFCPKMNVQILNHVGDNAALKVQFEKRSITGVKVLDMNIVDEGFDPYAHLGMGLGGTVILDAKIAWKNLLRMMIMMLQEKSTFSALDEANKNATKKQNVLGKLVIPKIINAIQYIWSELEEQEREESFRLKRFKQNKTKKFEVLAAKRKRDLALAEGKPLEKKEEEEITKEEPHLIKKPKTRALKQKEPEAEEVMEGIPKPKKVKREAPKPEKIPESEKVPGEMPTEEPTEELGEEEEENICPCCVAVRELDDETGTFICPICKLADDALNTRQEIKVNMVPCQTCLPEITENKDRLEHIMAHVNQIIRVTQQYTDNKNAIENRTNLFSYTTITEKSEFIPYCIQCTCAHMRVSGTIRGPPDTCPCDPPLESMTYTCKGSKPVDPETCTCDKPKPVKPVVCPHNLPKTAEPECPCDEPKPQNTVTYAYRPPKPAEPDICPCDEPTPVKPSVCPHSLPMPPEPEVCPCDEPKPVKKIVRPYIPPKSADSEICPCDEPKPVEPDPCPCDSPQPPMPEPCPCDSPQPTMPEPCPCDEPKPVTCTHSPPQPAKPEICPCNEPKSMKVIVCSHTPKKPAELEICPCDEPKPVEPDPCSCNPPPPPMPKPCPCDEPKPATCPRSAPKPAEPEICSCDEPKPAKLAVCPHSPSKPTEPDTCSCNEQKPVTCAPCFPKPADSDTCSCDEPKLAEPDPCCCKPPKPVESDTCSCDERKPCDSPKPPKPEPCTCDEPKHQQSKLKDTGCNAPRGTRSTAPSCCSPCPPSHSAAAVEHFKSAAKPYHALPTAASVSYGLNPIEIARKIAKASAVYLGLSEPKVHSKEDSCYPVCQGDVSARIAKASAPYLRSASIKKYPCTAPSCDDKPYPSNTTTYCASSQLTSPFKPVKSEEHGDKSSPKKPDSCFVCPICSNKLTPVPSAPLSSNSSSCSCDGRSKRQCSYSKDHATYYAAIPQWFSVKRTCHPNLGKQRLSRHDLINDASTPYLKYTSSNETASETTYPTYHHHQYYVLSTHYAQERKAKFPDRSGTDGLHSIMKDVATYVTTVSQRQPPFSVYREENKTKPCSCACTTSNTNISNTTLLPYTREGRPGPCGPGMTNTAQPISAQTLNYSTHYTREGRPGPCGLANTDAISPTTTVAPYTREGKPGPCHPEMSRTVEPNTREGKTTPCRPGICDPTSPNTTPYTREGRPGPCGPGMFDSARPITTVIPLTREGKPGPCYPGMSDTIKPYTGEERTGPCRRGICDAASPFTTPVPYTREGKPGPCGPVTTNAAVITAVIPNSREGRPGPCYPGMSDKVEPYTQEGIAEFCRPGICDANSPITAAIPYTREGRPGPCGPGMTDTVCSITAAIPYTREGRPGPCYPGMSGTVEPNTRERRQGPCRPEICAASNPITTVIPYTREGRPGPWYPGMSDTANTVTHQSTPYVQQGKPGSCGPGNCDPANPITTPEEVYTREGKPGPCGPSANSPFSRDPAVYYFVTEISQRRMFKQNISRNSRSECDIPKSTDLTHLLRTTRSNVSTAYYTCGRSNPPINSFCKDSSTYVRTVHQQLNDCNISGGNTSLESCKPSSTDLNSTDSSYSLDSCIPSSMLNLHSADYSLYLSDVYSNASTVPFRNIASTLSGKINLSEKKNSENLSTPMTHSTVTVNYVICQSDIQAAINKASIAYLDRSAQAWPLLPKIQDQIKKASRAYLKNNNDNTSCEYFDPQDMGAAIAKASAPYLKNAASVCSRSVESMSNAVFRLPSDRYRSHKSPSKMPTSRIPKWVNPNFMSVPSGISNNSSRLPTASSSQVGKDICAPYFNATKSNSRVVPYPQQDIKSCSCKVASEISSPCKPKYVSTPLVNAINDMPSKPTCPTCSAQTKNILPPIVSICSICCKCNKCKDLPTGEISSSLTDTLQSAGTVYSTCDKCTSLPATTTQCSKTDTLPSGASVCSNCRKSQNLPPSSLPTRFKETLPSAASMCSYCGKSKNVPPIIMPTSLEDTLPSATSVCSNCGKSKMVPPAVIPTSLEYTLPSITSICSNCGKSKNVPSAIIPLSNTEVKRVCPSHSSKMSNPSNKRSDTGYRETEFKEITKVSRYKNPDGAIVDEKQIITITTEKKTHHKLPNTNTIDVGTCISYSQEYDIDSQHKIDKKRSFECRPSHRERDNKSDIVTTDNDITIIPKLKRCISAQEYETPNNILFGTWEAGPELEITVSRTPLAALMPCMSSNISCGNRQKCSINVAKCKCLSKGTSMTIFNPTQQSNVGNVNNKSNYGCVLITPKPYKQFDTICANMLEDIARPKFNCMDSSLSTSIGIGPTYTDPVFAYILQNNSDISPAILPGKFAATLYANANKPEDMDYGLTCSSAKISPSIATGPIRAIARRTEDTESGLNCSCVGQLPGIDTDSDQKCSCPEASSCKSSGRIITNSSKDTYNAPKSNCAVESCSVFIGNNAVFSCPETSCFKPSSGPQYANRMGDCSIDQDCICSEKSPSVVTGIDPSCCCVETSPRVDQNSGLVHIVAPPVYPKRSSKCICPGEAPSAVDDINSECIWPSGSPKVVTGIDLTCICPSGSPSGMTSIAPPCTSVRSCPDASPCMQLPTDSLHNKKAKDTSSGLECICSEESVRGVSSIDPKCSYPAAPSVIIAIEPTCSCPVLSSSGIVPTSLTSYKCLDVSCYTPTDLLHTKSIEGTNSEPECICPEKSYIDPMCSCPISSIPTHNNPRCANCGGKIDDTDVSSWLSSSSSNTDRKRSSLKQAPSQSTELVCANCGVRLEDADLKSDWRYSSSSSSDGDLQFSCHKKAPVCINEVCANCGRKLENADFKTKNSFAFSSSSENDGKSCCTKAAVSKSTSLVCAKCGNKLEETYSGPKCSCVDQRSSVFTGIEPKCTCSEGAPCITNTQVHVSRLKDTVSGADCTRPEKNQINVENLKNLGFPPSGAKESLYASINSVCNIIQTSIERCLKCTGPEGSVCNQSESQRNMSYGSAGDNGTSTTNLVTTHIIVCESTLSNADSGVKCDCSSDHAMDKLIPLTTSDSCRLKCKPRQEITKVCGSSHSTEYNNIKEMLAQSKQRIDTAISWLETNSAARTNCSYNNSECINSTEQSCTEYTVKSNEDAIKSHESAYSCAFSALEAIKHVAPDIPAIKFLNVASSTSDLTPCPICPKKSTPIALWKDLSKIIDTKGSKGQCTVKLTRKAAKTRCCQKKDEEGIFFKGSFLESLRKILLLAKTPRPHRDRHNNPKICKPCYSPVSASFQLKVYPPPCSVCDISQSKLDNDSDNTMDIKPNTATPSCKSIGVGTNKRSNCCSSQKRPSKTNEYTISDAPIAKHSESCPKCNHNRYNNLVRSFSTPNSTVQPTCCINPSDTAKKTNNYKPIRKGKIIHICTTIRSSDHMCHSDSCISDSESRNSVKKTRSYHEDFLGF